MKPIATVSRREAMKLAAIPLFMPGHLFGAQAPSNKITLGSIGIGWQGGGNLGNFLGNDDCRVVAVADVDRRHLDAAAERVNRRYGNKDCRTFKDFRELLARRDIDAVCISTPDHWHSIPAILAARAKKDIFCEKPLSHTLAEGMAMVDAVQHNQRIWQTGSWQRSVLNFRWGAALVANGLIGKVKRVEVGLPAGHSDFEKTGDRQPNGNPPPEVDYEFWIGPAKMMPFNPCRFHKNWRWCYNTGGGQLMDWIGHHCDIAHWGLSNAKFGCGPDDQVGPREVSATAEFPPRDAVWNTATRYRIECKYPHDVEVVIAGGHKDIRSGTKWIGEGGWIWVSRAGKTDLGFDGSCAEWKETLRHGTLKVAAAEEKMDFKLIASSNHWAQFIDCVKSRQKTVTPIEVAHRSQTPGHLGYIASVVGRRLKWDAAKQEIVGDPEASKLLSKKFRAPWHV
jgi:predicted dehydrogenase